MSPLRVTLLRPDALSARPLMPSEALLETWRRDPAYRLAYHVAQASLAALFRAVDETRASAAPRERPVPLPRRQLGRR